MKNTEFICPNISREGNTLLFAGQSTVALAEKYGTPLYLFDEDRIRERCRTYKNAMSKAFGVKNDVLYASKAASFKRLYEIMKEEGMGIDVVSCGEIKTAKAAGFPLEKSFFHSNNKTDFDICYAIDNGVGHFVVDNEAELFALDTIAKEKGICQKILLRLTPGIDPHTYDAVATGKVDSKFGSAIETGQADKITETALSLSNIKLCGYHCHVGSQVFDSSVYTMASRVMLSFLKEQKEKRGFEADILDIGGGYGVRYTVSHPEINIEECIKKLAEDLTDMACELGISLPTIILEPGRSIVADSGMTLYTVGTVKNIPGYKTYISVDGGMTDNPRYALYGSEYTLLPASKMEEVRDSVVSVVGRCCESGDILQEGVKMPCGMERGDILACLTTGAYNYSMASNYNRIPRPPVVMLRGGESYLAVRRESLDDLVSLDV